MVVVFHSSRAFLLCWYLSFQMLIAVSIGYILLIRLDRDIQRRDNVTLVVVRLCARIWCFCHGLY